MTNGESTTPLGRRLRELRGDASQKKVAAGLRVSVPLVSSWESGKAVPPPSRIADYASYFAHGDAHAADVLRSELNALRPTGHTPSDLETRAPREGLWHFSDRSPITIACAQLPTDFRAAAPLSEPDSPDYVELSAYADLDALVELLVHVVSANPGVPVYRKLADDLTQTDFTNHLILLGGVDWNERTRDMIGKLNVPVSQETRDDDPDIGAFRVQEEDGTTRVFRSQLDGPAGDRRLIEDVAQFCRGPNPLNRKRMITICNGNYGRGTYAAVRTLTDPRFRDRNRQYVEERFAPGDTFNILAKVDIVAGEVITPDWTQEGTVLHEWSRSA